ncbi:MAG: hypothetical protein ACK5AZ_09740 [Bryobacteraceae bacterium]
MHKAAVFLLLFGMLLSGADSKRKPPKGVDVLILEVTAHRGEGIIAVDGKLRNTGTKSLNRLTLLFDFFAPGKVPLTTQKFVIDEEVLEPGEEAVFRGQLIDPVRAVRFRIQAEDGSGRYVKIDRNELLPIE